MQTAATSIHPRASVQRFGSSQRTDTDALEVYFKELERESLMQPKEELAAAQRILSLRQRYWAEMLTYVPLHGGILELILASMPESKREGVDLSAAQREVFGRRGLTVDSPKLVALAEQLADADPSCDVADLVTAEVQALLRGRNDGGHLRLRAAQRKSERFETYARRVERARMHLHAARSEFARANLRLVVSMAHRYLRSGRMSLDDLIQEGNVGLLTAVDRFDPRRGFRFSTYGSWWIRHAISRALSDRGRAVRLPVHVIELQAKLAKVRREFEHKHGREPDAGELAALADVPREKVERLGRVLVERDNPREASQDSPRPRGIDALADEDPAADTRLESFELDGALHEALDTLRPMEAEILRLRFGLDGNEGHTLREIGEVYSLSRERIRQIQQRALDKLREALVVDGFGAAPAEFAAALQAC
ncbi:MAG: RNA polymerase sigma factor RpoD/SigA [Nannocystaceae bacterium]|nr:sigma-70 family RNA polymerase sigma factor [bacterium]